MPTNADFQQAIAADPNDVMRWLLWADWLDENGASDQAEIIRLRSELTSAIAVTNREVKETRLRGLVYELQVPPPVVTMTTSNGMVLHLLPPGQFRMGSPAFAEDHEHDENQVSVTLTKGFLIGKYPVTQAQYEQVMGSNPSDDKSSPQHPVENVSYLAALEFCANLTARERRAGTLPTGWSFSLPTEAQWEFACRAGSTTAYCFGDNESQLTHYAWFTDNSDRKTHPVGGKLPNGWGLHDMYGNVMEWCLDWYDEKLAGGTDPRGPATGFRRVFRGGCFFFDAQNARSAVRDCDPPEFPFAYLGFRIVFVPAP